MGLITWSRHDTACKFKAHCSKRHYLVLHCNSCSTTKPIWHVNLTTLFWGHNIIYNTIGPWELELLIYQAHASHLQSYLSSILKSCISVKGRSSLCSLLERMMFLAPPVFSSVSGHLQLPFGIPNPMSATASVRQSFALNSKLASSALPMDPNHRTVCIVSFI